MELSIPTAAQYFTTPSPSVNRTNWDFLAHYVAGKAATAKLDPYKDHSAVDPELADVRIPGWSRYIYPPTLLPLYQALGERSYDFARSLWLLLYMAVYLAGGGALVLSCRRDLRPLVAALGVLLLTLSHPLMVHIKFGQIDALVAGLVCGSMAAHAWKQRSLSALLLALATVTKVSPAVFLIYFVIAHRDLRYLAWYAFWSAALVAASLTLVPVAYYQTFVTEVLPDIGRGAFSRYDQSIFKLFQYRFFTPKLLPPLGFGCLALLAWRLQPTVASQPPVIGRVMTLSHLVLAALCTQAILLLSPICWMMAYVWIIPFSSLLIVMLAPRLTARRFLLLVAGVALMCAMTRGIPIADSPNLAGNLLATAFFVLLLTRCSGAIASSPVQQSGVTH